MKSVKIITIITKIIIINKWRIKVKIKNSLREIIRTLKRTLKKNQKTRKTTQEVVVLRNTRVLETAATSSSIL